MMSSELVYVVRTPAVMHGTAVQVPYWEIFSDSEVVITVDFESTIRSSNLRRRNSQVLHFNAGGLVDPATDDHEDDLWTSFLSCLIFLPGYCSTVFLLMLTPFFG